MSSDPDQMPESELPQPTQDELEPGGDESTDVDLFSQEELEALLSGDTGPEAIAGNTIELGPARRTTSTRSTGARARFVDVPRASGTSSPKSVQAPRGGSAAEVIPIGAGTPTESVNAFTGSPPKSPKGEWTFFTDGRVERKPMAPPKGSENGGDRAWMAQLAMRLNRSGEPIAPENCAANVVKIVRHDARIGPLLRRNVMSAQVEWKNMPIERADMTRLMELAKDEYGVNTTPTVVEDCVVAIADETRYHPVRDYLSSAKPTWDRVDRLRHIAPLFFGTTLPLHAVMLEKWFLSAVARAYEPGCKVDSSLILQGEEGLRKSSFFETIAAPWFSDTRMDLRSKDSFQQLHTSWIYEWSEIDSQLERTSNSDVRAFLSSQRDIFRLPYERTVLPHPRSTVIVGTTNRREFLNDPCGSRRFWVVPVRRKVDIQTLRTFRHQLWAEATHRYLAGETWFLSEAQEAARSYDAKKYAVSDNIAFVVARYLYTQHTPLTAEIVMREAFDRPLLEDRTVLSRVLVALEKSGWINCGQVSLLGQQFRAWAPPEWVADGRAYDSELVGHEIAQRITPEAKGGQQWSVLPTVTKIE